MTNSKQSQSVEELAADAAREIDSLYEEASNNSCTCNIDENACRYCGAWERARRDAAKVIAATIRSHSPPEDNSNG